MSLVCSLLSWDIAESPNERTGAWNQGDMQNSSEYVLVKTSKVLHGAT